MLCVCRKASRSVVIPELHVVQEGPEVWVCAWASVTLTSCGTEWKRVEGVWSLPDRVLLSVRFMRCPGFTYIMVLVRSLRSTISTTFEAIYPV